MAQLKCSDASSAAETAAFVLGEWASAASHCDPVELETLEMAPCRSWGSTATTDADEALTRAVLEALAKIGSVL